MWAYLPQLCIVLNIIMKILRYFHKLMQFFSNPKMEFGVSNCKNLTAIPTKIFNVGGNGPKAI